MMRLRLRTPADASRSDAGSEARIPELERRLEHLEAAFEGLQDAVDRQARRQEKELDELTRSIQPGAMARALSDDARKRGI